jgi:hypothetical protein
MPTTISLSLVLVSLAVGFFVGVGWFTAGWLVGRVLR